MGTDEVIPLNQQSCKIVHTDTYTMINMSTTFFARFVQGSVSMYVSNDVNNLGSYPQMRKFL